MRSRKVAPSESKRRLLEAAERLFAEHGFDRVSVRDVTVAVKANVAAVNYHFGSREELVELVIGRCLMPVLDERLARMDLLEKRGGGKKAAVEEILDAWVRPVVGSARKTNLEEPWFSKLLGRIFFLPVSELPEEVRFKVKVAKDQLLRVLGKVLPHLGSDELGWRVQFLEGGLIHLLVNQESSPVGGGDGADSASMDSMLGRIIRCSAAGLKEGSGTEVRGSAAEGPQEFFQF